MPLFLRVLDGLFSPSGGPIKISYTNYAIAFNSWMAKAFDEVGIEEFKRFRDRQAPSDQYTPCQLDASKQSQSSSQTFCLNEALFGSRTNLKVYPNNLAKRTLFSSNKTATDVQVNSTGMAYTLSADKLSSQQVSSRVLSSSWCQGFVMLQHPRASES